MAQLTSFLQKTKSLTATIVPRVLDQRSQGHHHVTPDSALYAARSIVSTGFMDGKHLNIPQRYGFWALLVVAAEAHNT